MLPVLVKIGPLTVYSFGVMMAIGFYVGAWCAAREYARTGGDAEAMWNLLVWVFVAGLAGARLWSLINEGSAFFEDPLGELFSGSGFVWYGGVFGALAAIAVLHRRYRMRLSAVLDAVAPGAAIGQAIGRIGCHVAGDGDWGKVTHLPWGVAYRRAIVGWPHPPGVRVHPTPLYEAAAYTLVFVWLWRRRLSDPPPGTQVAYYLIATSAARFAIEFVRINPKVALGLTAAQWTALVLAAGAVTWLVAGRSAILGRAEKR